MRENQDGRTQMGKIVFPQPSVSHRKVPYVRHMLFARLITFCSTHFGEKCETCFCNKKDEVISIYETLKHTKQFIVSVEQVSSE